MFHRSAELMCKSFSVFLSGRARQYMMSTQIDHSICVWVCVCYTYAMMRVYVYVCGVHSTHSSSWYRTMYVQIYMYPKGLCLKYIVLELVQWVDFLDIILWMVFSYVQFRCCPASVPLLQQPHSLLQQHCWPHLPLPWCDEEGEWTAKVHFEYRQLESEWRTPLPLWWCIWSSIY